MSFPFDNTQALAVGAILFLMALFVVARAQRKLESRAGPGALPDAKKGAAGIDPALRDDLSDILLRLEETSRRVNGQLDLRFQMLNRLLADADAKILDLKTLSEKRPSPERASPSPAEDPQVAEIYRHADAGMSALEIARKVGRQRGEIDLILSLRKPGSRA